MITIDNPNLEKRIAGIARKQHKSARAVVETILAKQVEDAEDYAAAEAAMKRLNSGETVAIPLEDVMARYGL